MQIFRIFGFPYIFTHIYRYVNIYYIFIYIFLFTYEKFSSADSRLFFNYRGLTGLRDFCSWQHAANSFFSIFQNHIIDAVHKLHNAGTDKGVHNPVAVFSVDKDPGLFKQGKMFGNG